MSTPRYVAMDLRLEMPAPLEEMPGWFANEFVGVDHYDESTSWRTPMTDVSMAMEVIAYRHCQIPNATEPEKWANRGFDAALHHFFAEDLFAGAECVNLPGMPDQLLLRAPWFRVLSAGLLLGMLAARWDDVVRLCGWPSANLIPEYSGMGGDLEDELAYFYVVVAGGLRAEPMEGIDLLAEKVRRCRKKRPRLLMKSWDAVLARDQANFNQAIMQSLEHFASIRKDPKCGKLAEHLATHQSMVCLAAGHFGLSLPDLSPQIAYPLITCRSLGLTNH